MAAALPRSRLATVRLTQREIEVLRLVATGCRSQEAADYLCLSKRTIDFHLANTFQKLGVNNRVQALRAAVRLGLVSFEPSPRWADVNKAAA